MLAEALLPGAPGVFGPGDEEDADLMGGTSTC